MGDYRLHWISSFGGTSYEKFYDTATSSLNSYCFKLAFTSAVITLQLFETPFTKFSFSEGITQPPTPVTEVADALLLPYENFEKVKRK